MLRESGARIIRFLLYISKEEQAWRFRAPGRQIEELGSED
jgi:polyphosphate kinase 2 (PPK2 family)